eukprot:CAMPEP_0170776494 /NCGR_PEP_ID=MMETSP0733-20121128/11205_1 /TAXON_ID=186038 /ORGANISM="Fragilariopsis kerguelensis, Strain L26-C5" /LENGTH=365 /DNA_ID=CAMNT_0011119489 /DNA_START=20 /DNA_END=1118 /DNA_ORIENTATION=+
MGRKQKERQKKKNNQKLLAATTATASSGDAVGGNNSATAGRSSSVDGVDCVDVDVTKRTTEEEGPSKIVGGSNRDGSSSSSSSSNSSSNSNSNSNSNNVFSEAVGGGNNSATAGRSSSSVIDVDGGVAAAKKRTTTETTTMATCYHGSTAANVAKGINFQMALAKGSHFQKVIHEWLTILSDLAGENPPEADIVISNFHLKHKELMKNPEFNQCVFAVGTDIFLKNSYGSEEYSSSKRMVQSVIDLGIISKYRHCPLSTNREKCDKYIRDSMTDRGIINILERETNTFCNCMKPYKEVAKGMEKLGMCDNCHQDFPKTALKLCSRCLFVQYYSKECMKKSWPTHKHVCTPNSKSEEKVDKGNEKS